MGAPGVYIKAAKTAQPRGRLRTDRAVLLGYAAKGPVDVAVQLNSWRQFETVFGAQRIGYLYDSAKAYFDNGGRELFVIRVSSQTATTASVDLPNQADEQAVTINHRFRCYAAAPASTGPGQATQMRSVRKFDEIEPIGTSRYYRMKSPGNWGEDIKLNLALNAPSMLTPKQWTPHSNRLRLSSVANLQSGSLLDIGQLLVDGTDNNLRFVRVLSVDKARQEVVLNDEANPLIDPNKVGDSNKVFPSVLRLRVFYRQQLVEEYARLGLHPDHDRYFVEQVNQSSDYIAIHPLSESDDHWVWLDYLQGDYVLDGGLLQLGQITTDDFSRAITRLALENAIALVSAPDIVYREIVLHQHNPAAISDNRCIRLPVDPKGDLVGTIVNQVDETAISDARVIIVTAGIEPLILEEVSNEQGQFSVTDIPPGTATVSVEKAGYLYEDFTVTVDVQPYTTEQTFALEPLEMPPTFDNDQILSLQQLLVEQADLLHRHYVLLDTPAEIDQSEDVIDWRFQFDSRLASLVYPWLSFDELAQDRELPASGQVLGALAAADWQRGIIYATANLRIATSGQLKHRLSVTEHGHLNDNHINCLMLKSGENIRLMGARTLSFDRQWRYISSARLVLFVVQYINQRMQWAAFEPNTTVLRIAIVSKLRGLLNQLWRKGALKGHSARQAFSLVCDQSNNDGATTDAGKLVADIGLAIIEPAEFIWLKYTRQSDVSQVEVS